MSEEAGITDHEEPPATTRSRAVASVHSQGMRLVLRCELAAQLCVPLSPLDSVLPIQVATVSTVGAYLGKPLS